MVLYGVNKKFCILGCKENSNLAMFKRFAPHGVNRRDENVDHYSFV